MPAEVLIDTNVLVYLVDGSEPVKQERAIETLGRLRAAGTAVVTSQVLGEFAHVVCRAIPRPLTLAEARERVNDFMREWPVLAMDGATVSAAMAARERFGMAYWDAQLWASAYLAGVRCILTEDLPGAARVEDVDYVDPFAAGFDPASPVAGR